VRYRIEFILIR